MTKILRARTRQRGPSTGTLTAQNAAPTFLPLFGTWLLGGLLNPGAAVFYFLLEISDACGTVASCHQDRAGLVALAFIAPATLLATLTLARYAVADERSWRTFEDTLWTMLGVTALVWSPVLGLALLATLDFPLIVTIPFLVPVEFIVGLLALPALYAAFYGFLYEPPADTGPPLPREILDLIDPPGRY